MTGRRTQPRWALQCVALWVSTSFAGSMVWLWHELFPEQVGTLLHRVAAAAFLVLGWPVYVVEIAGYSTANRFPSVPESVAVTALLPLLQWSAIWGGMTLARKQWKYVPLPAITVMWIITAVWLCMFSWGRAR